MIAAGAYLRSLRKAKGFTQEALAAKVGVAGNTIYRIESGRQEPLTNQIVKLMAALDARAEDLAELLDSTGESTERAEQLAARAVLAANAALDSAETKASTEAKEDAAALLRRLAALVESGEITADQLVRELQPPA